MRPVSLQRLRYTTRHTASLSTMPRIGEEKGEAGATGESANALRFDGVGVGGISAAHLLLHDHHGADRHLPFHPLLECAGKYRQAQQMAFRSSIDSCHCTTRRMGRAVGYVLSLK